MTDDRLDRDQIPTVLPFQTARVIFALIMREMDTAHGRSPGGYLWMVLEPIAGIALMSYIFGLFLRTPPLGPSFPLFYATGLLPFGLYSDLMSKTSQAIRFSRPLLTYPRVTFVDAIIARFLLAVLTQVIVYYIIIAGIVIVQGIDVVIDYKYVAGAICLGAFLGLSVGSVNCLLFAFFPVWERIWAILNRPLVIISGTFYLYDGLPDTVKEFAWYNPIFHIVGLMRAGIYPEYVIDYVSIPYVLGWCSVPMAFGLYFLRVYHKKIMNEL